MTGEPMAHKQPRARRALFALYDAPSSWKEDVLATALALVFVICVFVLASGVA